MLSILNTIYNDAPQPWQIGFQDSAAPGFTGIVELHNTIFFYLVVICVAVFCRQSDNSNRVNKLSSK